MGMLQKAAAAAKPKADSKEPKAVVLIKNEEWPGLSTVISDFVRAKATIKAAAGIEATTKQQIVVAGRRIFLDQYDRLGHRPGSFSIQNPEGSSVTVVPMDAWGSIKDEDMAATIQKEIPEIPGIIEETTTFGFNSAILEKHFAVIEKALENIKIPQEDKDELIIATRKFSVKKGLLDQLGNCSSDVRRKVVEALSPTFSLRD